MSNETASGPNAIAITATATGSNSLGLSAKGDASGVRGDGVSWHGVSGFSQDGFGVYGESKGSGVVGKSRGWHGVGGFTDNPAAFGVYGESTGAGVVGSSKGWHGIGGFSESTSGGAAVYGEHKTNGTAVLGTSVGGVGVWGVSQTNEGVHAETKSPVTAAVAAYNLNPDATGAAVYAKKEGNIGFAGFFDGSVHVTRSISVEGDVMLTNGDCAEEFCVADPALALPGAVMVVDDEGIARACDQPYDNRVIGVVSGAGSYKPALILDRQGGATRRPIALIGKVYCMVDADLGAIRPGDLLTTSSTPGHAMRACDMTRAAGAMIGKALGSLECGRGMIPILAILQ